MAFDTALILRASAALSLSATGSATLGRDISTGASWAADTALAFATAGSPMLPLVQNAQLVVLVPTAEADAATDVALEISLDGTNYKEIACVRVPLGQKGSFAVNVGRAMRGFKYTAANLKVRTVCYNLSNAANTLTLAAYLTAEEADISGKTPADVLSV